MAVQIIGTSSGVSADVDADKNIRVVQRSPAFGSLGAYSMVLSTGAIAATLGANSNLFMFRWTDATRLALVQRIKVNAYVASTITTAVAFDLAAFVGRSFTVSPTTNITAATLSGNNNKRRTSMGTTILGGAWSCTTTGMTGATVTLDSQAFARISGSTGTATGTQMYGNAPQPIFAMNDGEVPIVLAQNEGIVIQNPLAGPATGTITATFAIDWLEVASY